MGRCNLGFELRKWTAAAIPRFACHHPDRLTTLIDRLADPDLTEQCFDMRSFGFFRYRDDDEGGSICTRCAFGWATTIPAFAAIGLKAQWEKDYLGGYQMLHVHYQGYCGWTTAAEFFGISEHTTKALFGTEPRTKEEEIAILRNFLAAVRERQADLQLGRLTAVKEAVHA